MCPPYTHPCAVLGTPWSKKTRRTQEDAPDQPTAMVGHQLPSVDRRPPSVTASHAANAPQSHHPKLQADLCGKNNNNTENDLLRVTVLSRSSGNVLGQVGCRLLRLHSRRNRCAIFDWDVHVDVQHIGRTQINGNPQMKRKVRCLADRRLVKTAPTIWTWGMYSPHMKYALSEAQRRTDGIDLGLLYLGGYGVMHIEHVSVSFKPSNMDPVHSETAIRSGSNL
eukprot:CAMPEP_0174312654 /NCGR_PEP_ID=MMETSP0810-20121108/4425_1 /TAXON_ID=73025 ORGANISM="Eutreptiella gymnastica-like, Strain CCMP1594" /NCGR_SAMPLE_ID=MMETSP0810 /ASSEMBLY_ACC=CAM_ASM_000659 /LENGTH=222 /DNA_ID=CAMNT_0015421101 /DNA_START=402 /DNA_END=1070 /DNA_ORIENTATION=+